ncbi:hypothetical protein [Mycobacterium sp. 1164985.4]|uniref:hypothetical protein n=1 Tax=Mycobacterium sp. 1164985.4 TaxID=1834069 RepID=UPI0007FD45E5|nr:hypothetical protein [Mycobacterium sp. 1164985.4]OBK78338.1 hypothetical protein A5650_10835 [Mycobacterium sp. 1164985.4]
MADEVVNARCAIMRARKANDKAAEIEARGDLAAAKIARVLAEAPPLSHAQRDRLAELLKPVRKKAARGDP